MFLNNKIMKQINFGGDKCEPHAYCHFIQYETHILEMKKKLKIDIPLFFNICYRRLPMKHLFLSKINF